MKWTVAVGTLMAIAVAGTSARASLTTSEVEQVRGYVATETHADRVRALVARPDLASDESAAAMSAALTGVPLDARRMAYLRDLVANGPSPATRPVLAVATARGLLARADLVFTQHPADLDRVPSALGELEAAYAFIADEVSDPAAGLDDAARADVGKALAGHVARNASSLQPDAAAPVPIARARAQAALALMDATPEGPTHRVDLADELALTGARRAALVEAGLLVLDEGGGDAAARIAQVRALLDRLPGAREGTAAVFVGDARATFHGRAVAVSVDAAGSEPLAEAGSPWGDDAAPPPIAASTMALARGLASVEVARALERRPQLRVQVEHDGGDAGVATAAAMLAVDGPRTVQVAAARLLAGQRDTAAAVADAMGALAVFAPAASGRDQGLAVPVGGAEAGADGALLATRVTLDPTGAASSFRLQGHAWRIDRDGTGAVAAMRRDGARVTTSMLPEARVLATAGSSWSGGGLVFARLSGAPRAAIAAGPRVRLLGSGVSDAIVAPAPGDDVAVDADLRVTGGPGGVVVRALPGGRGFLGASLLVVPGSPAHAALLVADPAGIETAAAPVVAIPASPKVHVRLSVRGHRLEAKVGPTTLTATLPAALAHGDLALRAYPGATVEASGWRVGRP